MTYPCVSRAPLRVAYLVEGFGSIGASLLSLGIFFYTEHYLHWTPLQNLVLAALQGMVYVSASLLAGPMSRRLRPRQHLGLLHLAMAMVAAVGVAQAGSPIFVPLLAILYSLFSAGIWPVLEGLVSAGAPPEALSRRISVYNLTWSGTNALAVAASGAIILWDVRGIFLVPLALNVMSLLLLWFTPKLDERPNHSAASATPEPELFAVRRLAMWLSRIVLPAALIVTYSLGAMLPSLPVLAGFGAGIKTLIASVWLVARWLMFLYLGLSSAWHTRPRLLLVAAVVLLLGFLGVVIRPSAGWGINLVSMLAWQVALGAAMGMIFSASLYFGMVLSQGSTEHGGYHEALIGVGQVVGPAVAALVQWVRPGDPRLGTGAVAAMVGLSIVAAGIATVRLGRRGAPLAPAPCVH